MRIGLIAELHGSPDAASPAPTWSSVRDLVVTAEAVGFDVFVYEDALLYRDETGSAGSWEAVAVSGAIAEATQSISFGPSVFNNPYRSPALTAKIAETLHEVSNGRFILGIGAGNTADSDYAAFGFPTDHRYSRFAESIEIIHGLLKDGEINFDGFYAFAEKSELILRGPGGQGPPINIAAGGPKMLDLAGRYGDAWNWWVSNETANAAAERLSPLVEKLDLACEKAGRNPSDVARTIDVYSVTPPGLAPPNDAIAGTHGSAADIADYLATIAGIGIDEVRCDLTVKTVQGVEAMDDVVDLIHKI